MRQVFLFFLFISSYCFAQEEVKYLEGAVPEVDGKVVFEKAFDFFQTSRGDIYTVALNWAEGKFKEGNSRIVYKDMDNGDIAVMVEDYLTFSSTSLALDRTLMTCRLLMHCEDNRIEIKINGIRYEYNVSYQREPEKYVAEEWITDKYALTKGKLNRINGKFRKATIDYVDNLFADLALIFPFGRSIAELSLPQSTKSPTLQSANPVTSADITQPDVNLSAYKQVNAESIPGNIIKLLSQDWMLITVADGDNVDMLTTTWGGLGSLFGKSVAFCFVDSKSAICALMEKSDTYTLTFYTEAYRNALQYCSKDSGSELNKVEASGLTPVSMPSGAKAFKEAWMIVECRKLLSQTLNEDSIVSGNVRKDCGGEKSNHLFVGEIVGVWIK